MADTDQAYEEAERRFLSSEGVTATEIWVDLDRLGGRVRLLEAGDGPPVLFVPGGMTSGAVFAGLVGRLPDFRCLMLDRPGTGLSPLTTPTPSTLSSQQRLGDDLLVDVLDGLKLDAASVVSTSLGGWYSFRSAASHPDRFTRISAMGFQVGARIERAPLSMRFSPPDVMLRRRPPVNRRIVRTVLKGAGMRLAIDSGRFDDEMLDWIVALFRETDTFGNESRYVPRPINLRGPVDAVRHTPELLAKVAAPVHFFWAIDDLFGGEASAREFAALLPDAQVQMVDQAGHAPWLDHPDMAADAVRTHLAT